MNQAPVDAMRVADLEAGRRLTPSVEPNQLERLAAVSKVCGQAKGSVRVVRDRNRVFLKGSVAVPVETPCHLCLEPVREMIASEFETELVSEAELGRRQLSDEFEEATDVHIVRDGMLDLTALLEDELLLAVRGQPCQDQACPNRPPLHYGNAVGERSGEPSGEPSAETDPALTPDRRRPFEGLRAMIEAESGSAHEQLEQESERTDPLGQNIKHSNE